METPGIFSSKGEEELTKYFRIKILFLYIFIITILSL